MAQWYKATYKNECPQQFYLRLNHRCLHLQGLWWEYEQWKLHCIFYWLMLTTDHKWTKRTAHFKKCSWHSEILKNKFVLNLSLEYFGLKNQKHRLVFWLSTLAGYTFQGTFQIGWHCRWQPCRHHIFL